MNAPFQNAKRLSVAVIGVGAMGQTHCRTIVEQVPEMRLTAVADADAAVAAEVGARHDVPFFASVENLLAAGVAQAAIVATPHPLHPPTVEACLNAGWHVLCEKPLAETVAAADRMLRCAREANRALAVMFQRRFEPAFEAALSHVRASGIGELRRALLLLPDFRTQRYYEANPWRGTWIGEGGGVLINQAPHLIDLFVLLGGLPRMVSGRVATCLHTVEVEDRADARLVYDNGAVGYLYASTNEPDCHETIELVGTSGSLTYRRRQLECLRFEPDLRALSAGSDDVWTKPALRDVTPAVATIPDNRLQGLVMGNFARHVLAGEPLRCDAASGAASLELANAIVLSSYRSAPVTLPTPRKEYDMLLTRLRAAGRPPARCRPAGRVTDPKLA